MELEYASIVDEYVDLSLHAPFSIDDSAVEVSDFTNVPLSRAGGVMSR